jgi:hypothetical protein
MKGQFKTEEYRNVDKMGLNNAVLLAYRRYSYRLEEFEALYEYLGRDLKKVIKFFKEVQKSKEEPDIFLERWMKERGLTVSSYRQGSIPVHSALRNPPCTT